MPDATPDTEGGVGAEWANFAESLSAPTGEPPPGFPSGNAFFPGIRGAGTAFAHMGSVLYRSSEHLPHERHDPSQDRQLARG